ncbi:MAG TPA: ATPase [Spirochaetaceae bacterium]|nr:ATPase [Spirochaetaceae bacterium]
MFRRKIEERLYEYYKNPDDRVLIVEGARQVGKSFIIRHTAKNSFENFIEIDLKADLEGDRLFANAKSTRDFYLALSSKYGQSLGDFQNTIVFLDEIQFYPHLMTLLKELKKEDRFRYIASGSLLGVTLRQIFIPMGSIEEVRMFPLDFEEFLWANGVGVDVVSYLRRCFDDVAEVGEDIHSRILRLFKDYLISGGFPDAVKEYVINQNVQRMRKVHDEIFAYYSADCSQYDNEHRLKIMRIYGSLISNMQNKVKRVQFKKIEGLANANAEKYVDEFDYLAYSGVALFTRAVSNPVFPLSETSSKNLLKLYYNDVGILTNLLFKNNINAILANDKGINLGCVYETACACELASHGHELFYFDSKKTGEVDFLINDYDKLSAVPIEIKSGNDQNNFRAIPKLVDRNGNYKLSCGYVFGNKNVAVRQNDLIIMPVYMIMFA